MPRIERQSPPYVQITDHYRAQFVDGVLPPGSRLPGVHDLAREWGVSPATAAKALGQLGVEGLITTSPRGSYVAELGAEARRLQERPLREFFSAQAGREAEIVLDLRAGTSLPTRCVGLDDECAKPLRGSIDPGGKPSRTCSDHHDVVELLLRLSGESDLGGEIG